jgi:hypothetical protein
MKKILWFSRHALTKDQVLGLEKVFGDTVETEMVDATVKAGADVVGFIKGHVDGLAVVLPTQLLAEVFKLMPKGTLLLVPRSKRILVKVEGQESQIQFVHDGWEVVDNVVFETHIIK